MHMQPTTLTDRATLDFIGLPTGVPGNLECRFQKATFRDDGTWIDDGSRSGKKQSEKHRVVLSRGQSIRRVMAGVSTHLATMGYDAPDIGLIRHVAQHEWRHDVIAARGARLKVTHPELCLVVRALGFDIEGRGELAIGLGKVTIRPDGATLTQKAALMLQPGDPLDLVFEAIDAVADRIGYQRLCDEDVSLVRHVARKLWTNEAISKRHDAWAPADTINGDNAEVARMIEFAQRLDGINAFNNIPVGATPTPEPMRIIN